MKQKNFALYVIVAICCMIAIVPGATSLSNRESYIVHFETESEAQYYQETEITADIIDLPIPLVERKFDGAASETTSDTTSDADSGIYAADDIKASFDTYEHEPGPEPDTELFEYKEDASESSVSITDNEPDPFDKPFDDISDSLEAVESNDAYKTPTIEYEYDFTFRLSNVVSGLSTSYSPGDDISLAYEHCNVKGIIEICATGSERDFAIILTNGDRSYNYRLKPDINAIVPFNMGNGEYTLGVYLFIEELWMALLWSIDLHVELSSEQAPYLNPSLIVNWTNDMALAKTAKTLAAGNDQKTTALEVCRYISQHFLYDESLEDMPLGYIPSLDKIFDEGRGICYDFAALYTAMCRSVGIPTKLVIGYSLYLGPVYHAWCLVWIDEQWLVADPTYSMSRTVEFLDMSKTVEERHY